ncbi:MULTISPECIES: HD domain-containing protein [unclassified Moritella]|uniref:HD domain-containing protein n=1 Tax=unclassified Moritella TaxID=2637987 RepID=UPI001BA64F6F|nr:MULTISPECIES: HD domain-containing protein [unclassified Moritella]QUM85572.1 HD domain-containing protein [Moritella sp. 28]QUM89789.1 HD domain-containing protein [Moritella sp. 36]
MENIERVLNFIVEIEKLKGVLRKTKPVGLDRYENSAEHSWHVCISALMLKDYADDEINIDRVIKMLLLHDLGEIDAGDTIVYAAETAENKAKEASGINRLLNILPPEQAKEYIELWHEFELGVTADSVYAKAIDRVPPLLHNIHGEGHSWKAHNISKEQVFSVNSRIGKGSKQLWTSLEQKLEKAVSQGLLK